MKRWLLALCLLGCKPTEAPKATPAPQHESGVVLTAEAQKRAGVVVEPVARHALDTVLATTGELEANADREAHVTTRVAGRAVRVLRTVGDRVQAGDVLAVVESLELGKAEAAYLDAVARLELARGTRERQRQLFANDLNAKKEVQAAEHQVRLTEIDRDRDRNQLVLLGLGADRIAGLARSGRIDATVPMSAKIAGTIVQRHVTLGEALEPGSKEPAFVLSDARVLWADATLYERDLAKVRAGQTATVTTPAYPTKVFTGRVALVSNTMDRDTRTAKARVEVANVDGSLKPDMFANIMLHVGRQDVLAVPSGAVVLDRGKTLVFVQVGPERFEPRPIQAGPPVDGLQPVPSGLALGDKVVTAGAFTLKSELLKGSFGDAD
ncbi:MAG: Secretion protein HlyD [Cyanobacteria bacterium RYN_339]|nr:Secretion protein HlyD [Cyanobacteria bacterium RYN_339]